MNSTELLERVQNYLENGGLFNPELMEHDKVGELLRNIRDHLQDEIVKSGDLEEAQRRITQLKDDLKMVRFELSRMTDRDLAPIMRTESNYWKCKFLEATQELVKANRGIRRLRVKLDKQ